MQFSVHDPCGGGNASLCAPRILGRGPITTTDAKDLRSAVDSWRKEGTSYFSGITLSSPGGNLYGGLLLGKEIRRLQLDTIAEPDFKEWVPAEPNGPSERIVEKRVECFSACAYAVLGGLQRAVTPGAIYGIHQFSAASQQGETQATAQVTGVILRNYIREMGVNPELLDLASVTSANSIMVLSQDQVQALRVDNSRRISSIWKVIASKDGSPRTFNVTELSAGREMITVLLVSEDTLVVNVMIHVKAWAVSNERFKLFPVGSGPELRLIARGVKFKGLAMSNWTKRFMDDGLAFECTVAFKPEVARKLADANSLLITDEIFGRQLSDIGVHNAHVNTAGFSEGMKLLLRTR